MDKMMPGMVWRCHGLCDKEVAGYHSRGCGWVPLETLNPTSPKSLNTMELERAITEVGKARAALVTATTALASATTQTVEALSALLGAVKEREQSH